MKYILITAQGRIMTFYMQGLAETYQVIHGGILVPEHAVEQAELTQAEERAEHE